MTSAFQIQNSSRKQHADHSNDLILETETGLEYSFPLGPTRLAITIADQAPQRRPRHTTVSASSR